MIDCGTTNREQLTADLSDTLLQLGWQLRQDAQQIFESLELTPAQAVILLNIDSGFTQPKKLAEALGMHFSATSTLVRQLNVQGFLERRGSNDDGRFIDLALTTKGEGMLADVKRAWQENSTLNFSQLTASDVKALVTFLRSLRPTN